MEFVSTLPYNTLASCFFSRSWSCFFHNQTWPNRHVHSTQFTTIQYEIAEDSTGVPHILEHSVLCGSRKYTTKDPFVQLLQGSLQTFLNAFTYPDRTCYVVASQNDKDFYNLISGTLSVVCWSIDRQLRSFFSFLSVVFVRSFFSFLFFSFLFFGCCMYYHIPGLLPPKLTIVVSFYHPHLSSVSIHPNYTYSIFYSHHNTH